MTGTRRSKIDVPADGIPTVVTEPNYGTLERTSSPVPPAVATNAAAVLPTRTTPSIVGAGVGLESAALAQLPQNAPPAAVPRVERV